MNIAILDFQGHDHEVLTKELQRYGHTIFHTTKQVPDSCEKIVRITRLRRGLTSHELDMESYWENTHRHVYLTAVPEDLREPTKEAKKDRLRKMKEEVCIYAGQWENEANGGFILSDETFESICEEMIQKSGQKITLSYYSQSYLPFLARYLSKQKKIILNPARMRMNPDNDTIERLQLTLAHELGHAVDPEHDKLAAREQELLKMLREKPDLAKRHLLFSEYKSTVLKREANTYKYCGRFIPHISTNIIQEAEKQNENGYEKWLKAMERQLFS